MVQMFFSDEMTGILRDMKGKTFKSYECSFDGIGEHYIWGTIRINLGRYAVDIINREKIVPYFDEIEDISCFECRKMKLDDEYNGFVTREPFVYMVDEVIRSVEIVRDDININDGQYCISFDMAVVIRTDYNCYTLSRGNYFSEEMHFTSDKIEAKPYPVEKVIRDWIDEEEGSRIDVQRECIVL